jgi:hypothetical protein
VLTNKRGFSKHGKYVIPVYCDINDLIAVGIHGDVVFTKVYVSQSDLIDVLEIVAYK